MSNDELKQLITKRRIIKASVTRFETYLNNFDVSTADFIQLKTRKTKFDLLWDQFENIQMQIEILDSVESQNEDSLLAERDSFENSYFGLESKAQKLLDEISSSTSTSSNSNQQSASSISHSNQNSIRLPVIDLPKFSGSYDKWYEFHNTFDSLINSSKDLSNVQKLQYLKSCLQGDAAQVLASLEISDANYDCAWQMLKERYDNKRLIVNKHIQCILHLPVMTKENFITLRQILDGLNQHSRILKALGRSVDTWDDLLIQITINKLDTATVKEWEATLKQTELPDLKQFIHFLTQKCNFLETFTRKDHAAAPSNNKQNKYHNKQSQAFATHVAVNKLICAFCTKDHLIYKCEEFLKLSIKERFNQIKNKQLCVNCLRKGHSATNCKSGVCKQCNKKHNTLLHFDNSTECPPVASVSNHVHFKQAQNQFLLATAIINILDGFGNFQECRALLDSASQPSLITQSLVDRLNLKKQKTNIPVAGVDQIITAASSSVNITIKSRFNAYQENLQCLVLNNITSNLPLHSFKKTELAIPKNIKLADPNFNLSSPIDLLIGVELFWNLLCIGQIKLKKNQPTLQKTNLGWIISGKWSQGHQNNSVVCNLSTLNELNTKLTQFWQLEEYSGTPRLTHEEQRCEDHFKQTYKRNSDGRFIVKIPFKENPTKSLGDTKQLAIKRFHSLERKFTRDPDFKDDYAKFINEYIAIGHMKLASTNDNSELDFHTSYYLPHHAVRKDTSSTTKLRVVFDGSAKSTTGVSLNDIQMVGPVIQHDLFSITIRFRSHKIALTADIAKMYRQILIDQSQTCLQRILWRENPTESLQTYELSTVTYGTASASFLAIRALHQLAIEESHNHPISSKITLRDFYVDDLLTGANTIEEAKILRDDITCLLAKGGFELRKWASNHSEVTDDVNSISHFNTINLNKDTNVSALGLQWNTSDDTWRFSKPNYEKQSRITKRLILANIAQIFDPLGLIGPVITTAKLIMQRLWQLKITWDESVPASIYTSWNQFKMQLDSLQQISIPRWVINCDNPQYIELHGFCDASEQAYGACIYIRTTSNDGRYYSHLLCSKSRVAPLKNISVPKLELCGALLLAQLMKKVIQTIEISFNKIYYWTDSTITLCWIKSTARVWKTFVANRVGEIQDMTNINNWHHIPTTNNPADIISRGSSLHTLLDSTLWWTGPAWLSADIEQFPNSSPSDTSEFDIPERRANPVICGLSIEPIDIFSKYSSFTKLLRITALCLRFAHNIKVKLNKTDDAVKTNSSTAAEINNAHTCLLKIVQRSAFTRELQELQSNGTVNPKSRLLCLNPFLDDNGLIRVGGRLRNATIPYSHKHQVILPKEHAFTRLVIEYEHKRHLHSGMQLTLAAIRKLYWPLGARNTIRDILHKCVICFKMKPKSEGYIMGNLPAHRVTPSRPFANTGVDYFGPLYIREGRRKNSKITKAYGAIFVCFATKAVHLELAGDLSTETFLGAMKRFIARRGKPNNMYSDNATNFTGANNELKELHEIFTNEYSTNKIINEMSENNINWHFIPPKSPHFGGIWEASVKSTKHHLYRILGNASLRYEEMYTLLVQIEAILNSRPLTPISNDPNDFSYLTPGHFLIGDYLTSNAEPNLSTTPANRLSRWQHLERLRQHFWTRWSKEYLGQLQERTKWKSKSPNNVAPGQLVLIREDNVPPLRWPMGRIDAIHPGPDGVPRAVTVRTSGGIFKRPTLRLCPLPFPSD